MRVEVTGGPGTPHGTGRGQDTAVGPAPGGTARATPRGGPRPDGGSVRLADSRSVRSGRPHSGSPRSRSGGVRPGRQPPPAAAHRPGRAEEDRRARGRALWRLRRELRTRPPYGPAQAPRDTASRSAPRPRRPEGCAPGQAAHGGAHHRPHRARAAPWRQGRPVGWSAPGRRDAEGRHGRGSLPGCSLLQLRKRLLPGGGGGVAPPAKPLGRWLPGPGEAGAGAPHRWRRQTGPLDTSAGAARRSPTVSSSRADAVLIRCGRSVVGPCGTEHPASAGMTPAPSHAPVPTSQHPPPSRPGRPRVPPASAETAGRGAEPQLPGARGHRKKTWRGGAGVRPPGGGAHRCEVVDGPSSIPAATSTNCPTVLPRRSRRTARGAGIRCASVGWIWLQWGHGFA